MITVLIACTSDVLSIKLIAKTSVTNSTLCFLLGLKRLQVLHLNLPSIFEFIFVHDVKRRSNFVLAGGYPLVPTLC